MSAQEIENTLQGDGNGLFGEPQTAVNRGEATYGLNCPNCGGVVPVPEGHVIAICPYCDLRSFVKGERGLQRYQVPRRVTRDQALEALKRFLSSNFAIARGVAQKAVLEDTFIAHVPFWVTWGRVFGWVFGQKRVGSGDNKRYEPREVRSIQEMTWNGVACDVGEFGVSRVTLEGRPIEAFDAEALHTSGMVFEPVGSRTEASQAAARTFSHRLRNAARLDRISQVFERSIQERSGLVYYPLWVLRYLYRGRSFQVVVDGFSGEVLYGKAPGSTFYRAGVLVVGMALGAFLAVDASALALFIALSANGDDSEGLFAVGVFTFLGGIGLMAGVYHAYRYGEHYEFRQSENNRGLRGLLNRSKHAEDALAWLEQLS